MIIFNNHIPAKGFKAMAIFPFIFVRGDSVSDKTINHENIHFEQQKELLLIFFYLLYFIFWLRYGYKNNPFEREAYDNAERKHYLKYRTNYSWVKYLSWEQR